MTTIFASTLLASTLFLSTYDHKIYSDHPVLYMTTPQPTAGLGLALLPNGDFAPKFDGVSQYLQVNSNPKLSVPTTGILTIEAWVKPDTLQFSHEESDGYVYWFGKGSTNNYEYAGRMYSLQNNVSRPNRISAYAYNLTGGLGSGAYFQDKIYVGQWLHVAVVINTKITSQNAPTGYIRIYKNSSLRQTVPLNQFDVIPEAGTAPLRIGTRDLHSFFKGSIGKFAVYNYELTAGQIYSHYHQMTSH